MTTEITPSIGLAGGGLVFAVIAILAIMLRPDAPGNAALVAAFSAGFAVFSAITIATEGLFR